MKLSNQTLLEVITADRPAEAAPVFGKKRLPARRRDNNATRRWNSSIVGSLVAIGGDGSPIVDFPENPGKIPISARSCVLLSNADVGALAVLLFEGGDPSRPIVMGKILDPTKAGQESPEKIPGVSIEQGRLTLSADREIVLSCGESSITLTRAGKVLTKGAYLLSRSTGVNRIKGGSVQIN